MSLPLKTLALEAVGKLITGFTEMTVVLSHYTTIEEFTVHCMKPMCAYVENMIQENIPPILADEVTNYLMTCIMKTYNDLDRGRYTLKLHKTDGKLKNLGLETIVEMCYAILHPCVTKFQFSRAQINLFYGYFQITSFTNMLLKRLLRKLERVEVLMLEIYQFSGCVVQDGLSAMKNLQELIFWGCNDAVLAAVSKSCHRLKKLDIRNSTGVSNKSIAYILSFNDLKHIDIINTSINQEGVSRIMTELHELKVFKADLDCSQAYILPDCLPNLSSIHARLLENCTLIRWKYLRFLKSLHLSHHPQINGRLLHYEDLVEEIGPQLTHLNLIDMTNTNLRFIAKNCPSLQFIGIHLMSPEANDFYDNVERYHLEAFPSIESCDIEIAQSYVVEDILTSFVSVKKVSLKGFKEPFDSLIVYLLLKMAEGSLEELYIFGNRIQLSGDNLIVTKANGSSIVKRIDEFKNIIKSIICWTDVDFRNRAFKQS